MRKIVVALAVAVTVGMGAALTVSPAKAEAAAHPATPCTHRQFKQWTYNDTCVGYIQKMLSKAGGMHLDVDNDFGPLTKKAVVAWQEEQKKTNVQMLVDGIVGKQTWRTLCDQRTKYPNTANAAGCNRQLRQPECTDRIFSIRTNAEDACVGHIKSLLNLADGAQLNPDDKFGRKTKAAVRDWQDRKNIRVDGIVGPQTWRTLCRHEMSAEPAQQDVYDRYTRLAGCRQ